MGDAQIIQANLTYVEGAFRDGVRVAVGEDGRIHRVGALADRPTLTLERQALLPGMVNVHSHAFQRALRGRGERFPAGLGSFWTWREAMYELVESMTPDRMHAWCVQAFQEMLRTGITTVGEFHYLHHDAHPGSFAIDEVVLDAARESGIRLVLLLSYYKTGGIGQPLSAAQQRFATPSPREFWAQFDRLTARLDPRTQTMGIAPHSIRAVPLEDLRELFAEARRRGVVVHMHLEEQPSEIEDCVVAYGRTPVELCLERLDLDDRFTAVHCTHTQPDALARLAGTGANICVCPLTEGNLGDGVPKLTALEQAGASLCLGTDSNARLDFIEDMRWLEYGQRLTRVRRGCLADPAGNVAPALFQCATTHGAQALNLGSGLIEPGSSADFFTLDLAHASLEGWSPDSLLESTIFGSGSEIVRRVCVAGQWVR